MFIVCFDHGTCNSAEISETQNKHGKYRVLNSNDSVSDRA